MSTYRWLTLRIPTLIVPLQSARVRPAGHTLSRRVTQKSIQQRALSIVNASQNDPLAKKSRLASKFSLQQTSSQSAQLRAFQSTTSNMTEQLPKKDWSAIQYLKFGNERTRAVYDLLSQVAPRITNPNPRIYDLGCGPGNSTKVLLEAFPNAKITGMDSSPDMLQKARATLPTVEFVQGDLSTFQVPREEQADLLFSNAVFHWLRHPQRIPTLATLFENMPSGGVIAIQVPDNYHEPSHSTMRSSALLPSKPWSEYFADSNIGNMDDSARPDLDPIEPPDAYYNALIPHAGSVNIWRTNYQHVLKDHAAIVEWVTGTGLQPYLNRIENERAKEEFLKEYEEGLKGGYKSLVDGKVLLGYPRLFVVAVRK